MNSETSFSEYYEWAESQLKEKLWCVIGKAKEMEIAIRQMDDLYE